MPFGIGKLLDSDRSEVWRITPRSLVPSRSVDTDQSVVVSDRKKGGHPTYKKKNSRSFFVLVLFDFYRKNGRLL